MTLPPPTDPVVHGNSDVGHRDLEPIVPNLARVYDYWLGGTENFAPDRQLGEQVKAMIPWIVPGILATRANLRTTVEQLTFARIDQFLDIGSGLPTRGNVHEIAQAQNPHARVVYVDNDPVVLAHAIALVGSAPGVHVLAGDLRRPAEIVDAVRSNGWLDLARPIGLLIANVMHFIPDEDRPLEILATLRAALAPGSYLMMSQTVTGYDEVGLATREAGRLYSQRARIPFAIRTREEFAALFEGWEPLPAGVRQLTYEGTVTTGAACLARLP